MNDLLKELTTAVGVSGDEAEIRTIIRDKIVDHVDSWRVDAMGNLLAFKAGTGARKLTVMLDAHMDEIGMIITGVNSDGTLSFDNVGGIDGRTLAGKLVQIGRKKITGIIGVKPIHLSSAKERIAIPSSLKIDVGAKDKAGASGKVKVGDRATFISDYTEFGDNLAMAKAFDNRAGCAAIIELLQHEPFPCDIVASFSSQEEIGLRGAAVVAVDTKPDAAIILETTPAYDMPNKEDVSPNTVVGNGPSLYLMDRMAIQDPRMVRFVSDSAERTQTPYQFRKPGGGGTNTGMIQRTGAGIPTATIGLPNRHAHTPNGVISLTDYQNVIKLTETVLRSLTREIVDRTV